MPWSVFLLDERLPLPAKEVAKLVQEAVGGVVYDFLFFNRWIAEKTFL